VVLGVEGLFCGSFWGSVVSPASAPSSGVSSVPVAAYSSLFLFALGLRDSDRALLFNFWGLISKSPSENSWKCFIHTAFAEFAGRNHSWIWAWQSLYGFGLCWEKSKGLSL
jgi:hypothetical protein